MTIASILIVVVGLVALGIGLLVGYILRKSIGEKTVGNAEMRAKNLILEAEDRAEKMHLSLARLRATASSR
jgi:ribonuclease Y